MREIPLAPQGRKPSCGGVLWRNGLNANATLRSSASSLRSRFGGVGSLRSTRVDDEDYEWLSG